MLLLSSADFFSLLRSMSLISPNFEIKLIIFSKLPFPKIAGKSSAINGNNFCNAGQVPILIYFKV